MTFVPPTPSVKVNIAAGASAADLGWSQSFYEKFCWQYGLQPMKPKESVASLLRELVKEEPQPPTVPESTGDPFRDAVSERWQRCERREIEIEYQAGKSKARKLLLVGRHEAATLLALARTTNPDGWVTGAQVCAFEGRTHNASSKTQISTSYRILNKLLAGSPLDLHTLKGSGSRLRHVVKNERAHIRVVRLGNIEIA